MYHTSTVHISATTHILCNLTSAQDTPAHHFLVSLSLRPLSNRMKFALVQYLQAAVIILAVKLVVPQDTATEGERLYYVK